MVRRGGGDPVRDARPLLGWALSQQRRGSEGSLSLAGCFGQLLKEHQGKAVTLHPLGGQRPAF